jgi:acyl-CoA dehydrogenase
MIRDSETLNVLLDNIARFVRERLVPNEELVAETDEIPPDVVADMKAMGLFGLTIPEAYGGLELTMEEEVLAMLELGKTSPAFRSLIGTTVGIGSQGILFDGTDEQKRQYLPRLATGELIASFALTEPGSGSDAASLRTSAIRDGEHYVVNGTKRFITNAPQAGIFTLMARTNPDEKGTQGISAFIVDATTPGISFGRRDRKMGQKGAHTCDVIFDNCRVPAANLIGGAEGRGFKTAMKVLDKGRIHIASSASPWPSGCSRMRCATRPREGSSASPLRSSSSYRPCWPIARRRPMRHDAWCWTLPAVGTTACR